MFGNVPVHDVDAIACAPVESNAVIVLYVVDVMEHGTAILIVDTAEIEAVVLV